MYIIPARLLENVIKKAKKILKKDDIKITTISDGISVIMKK